MIFIFRLCSAILNIRRIFEFGSRVTPPRVARHMSFKYILKAYTKLSNTKFLRVKKSHF